MKYQKRIRIVFLLLGLLVMLGGCSMQKESKRDVLRVGVVLYTQDDPFINALTDCLKADFKAYESDALKITMTVRDGRNDQETQNDVVEGIIDAGCDLLVVDLVDRTEPARIIEMARKEDIPVIFFNREPVKEDLMQWEKLYYVGGDARQSGVMQGEIAASVISANALIDRNQDGKIQYVLLEGEAGHQDAIIRTDSVVKTLMEQGIQLEKLSYQFANWNRAQAENKMVKLLAQYGDEIELVLANNDEMALGAVAAYEELSYALENRPPIFGIDGLDVALEAVKEGTLQGTVYQDKEGEAYQIASLAVDLFKGNDLSKYTFVNERYILLPYRKIDADTILNFQKEN